MAALMVMDLEGGELHVEIDHRYEGRRVSLSSLSYEADQVFSVTRFSYLLSGVALRRPSGEWVSLEGQYAWIDLEKRRTSFTLSEVPAGEFTALRFSIGLDQEVNHAGGTGYTATHPLNPNLNRLHWTAQDGYIFMAIEGLYRDAEEELSGYVYHLANDWNYKEVELAVGLQLEEEKASAVRVRFDLQALFHGPQPITFLGLGDSSHSHKGDAIAQAMVTNLLRAFMVTGVTDAARRPRAEKVDPLYLPEDPKGYPFKVSAQFPRPQLPLDNPLLVSRVALGERLFHDASLSQDGSISCASCHDPAGAFTDNKALSRGINRELGVRHSMPLFNLAWKERFFWDGRAASLREQVLEPLQDHREMGESLERVAQKAEEAYGEEFTAAFGAGEVTAEKVALALECFLLTLTSYDSRFDQAMKGRETLTAQERRGFELFFTEYEPRSGSYGADCFHCHGGALFTDHSFHNNGIVANEDHGLEVTTGRSSDRYKFSTPSLRNIALTAPYMHDGRFATLEEVMTHYNSEIQRSDTLDPNLAKHPRGGINLPQEDLNALVAFLKTLSDPKYMESKR